MDVILSPYAGACFGVQRALDLAEGAIASAEPAVTLGPIIHNPKVVKHLNEMGIRSIESLDEANNEVVIIRSHGVAPEVKEEIVSRGLSFIDATCPHVAHAQKAVEKLAQKGCLVVVVGEAGHPEVEGLTACARKAGAKAVVAAVPADLPEGLYDPIGLVSQTTQTREAMEAVIEALRSRGLAPQVEKTICYATQQRQEAAAELAKQVDAMVILGGRNSSNTTRLFEICQAAAPAAYHIESVEEIQPQWFRGCTKVGVSAGASTPEDQIRELIQYLENL